eukprot:CAMPEP_0113880478 /NCGR_PEP_ID=MMETSP0780_2-20120614/7810_2 /TAXON_ID=652834 /ORGANISM="Palpitomonas bilix" /LENGTH=131 /DNA_ID=CAMNT_0000867163 /DNA_START=586 /DNA_END=981 /DNA_ORIENTATION=- /assembly_acc=CAM_ASM_000599
MMMMMKTGIPMPRPYVTAAPTAIAVPKPPKSTPEPVFVPEPEELLLPSLQLFVVQQEVIMPTTFPGVHELEHEYALIPYEFIVWQYVSPLEHVSVTKTISVPLLHVSALPDTNNAASRSTTMLDMLCAIIF